MEKAYLFISDLAKASGVTVRTLHYYDKIGLLVPQTRTGNHYRVYSQDDTLKLQQILFYRELGFTLLEIKKMLVIKGLDLEARLREHKVALEHRIDRYHQLINTIDNTILFLNREKTMLTDEELYKGFTKEEIHEINKEVELKYDPKIVAESRSKVRGYSKQQWEQIKAEGEQISKDLAEALGKGLEYCDKEVQGIIARHYRHLHNFYTPTPQIYRGLGEMYAADPRFRKNYDKYRTGLADFVKKAIEYYCDHTLTRREKI
jgi:DNA-binding transcriptional MerR regulator